MNLCACDSEEREVGGCRCECYYVGRNTIGRGGGSLFNFIMK